MINSVSGNRISPAFNGWATLSRNGQEILKKSTTPVQDQKIAALMGEFIGKDKISKMVLSSKAEDLIEEEIGNIFGKDLNLSPKLKFATNQLKKVIGDEDRQEKFISYMTKSDNSNQEMAFNLWMDA